MLRRLTKEEGFLLIAASLFLITATCNHFSTCRSIYDELLSLSARLSLPSQGAFKAVHFTDYFENFFYRRDENNQPKPLVPVDLVSSSWTTESEKESVIASIYSPFTNPRFYSPKPKVGTGTVLVSEKETKDRFEPEYQALKTPALGNLVEVYKELRSHRSTYRIRVTKNDEILSVSPEREGYPHGTENILVLIPDGDEVVEKHEVMIYYRISKLIGSRGKYGYVTILDDDDPERATGLVHNSVGNTRLPVHVSCDTDESRYLSSLEDACMNKYASMVAKSQLVPGTKPNSVRVRGFRNCFETEDDRTISFVEQRKTLSLVIPVQKSDIERNENDRNDKVSINCDTVVSVSRILIDPEHLNLWLRWSKELGKWFVFKY